MKDTCQWTTVVNLKMKNIPETIIVAAWSKALTGVGAAIAMDSMINVGMLLIIVTNYDFTLTYIFLRFYLLFYNLTCIGYFGVLLR